MLQDLQRTARSRDATPAIPRPASPSLRTPRRRAHARPGLHGMSFETRVAARSRRTALPRRGGTMRAILLHAVCEPEALRVADAPDPTPGRGEVVVRLRAAA